MWIKEVHRTKFPCCFKNVLALGAGRTVRNLLRTNSIHTQFYLSSIFSNSFTKLSNFLKFRMISWRRKFLFQKDAFSRQRGFLGEIWKWKSPENYHFSIWKKKRKKKKRNLSNNVFHADTSKTKRKSSTHNQRWEREREREKGHVDFLKINRNERMIVFLSKPTLNEHRNSPARCLSVIVSSRLIGIVW